MGAPPMNFIEGRLARAGETWRFEAPALSLALPPGMPGAPGTQGAEGQPVVLGLRPEQLRLPAPRDAGQGGTPDDPGEARFEGTLSLLEPHGSHRIAWLDCAGTSIAVLEPAHAGTSTGAGIGATGTAGSQPMAPGTRLRIACSSTHAHLFDSRTGLRL